jgi:competence protein ComEC
VYWLVGILIITTMIGTLTVAGGMTLPDSYPFASITHPAVWVLWLMTFAIGLFFIRQRHAFDCRPNHGFNPQNPPSILTSSFKVIRYSLAILFVIILIMGSALRAINSHQQLESSKVTEPMRVQAWVTIEGISDSVYDPATNSGYRQVATLRAIRPLITELTAADLTAQKLKAEIARYNKERINNSLSKNYDGTHYRVLLNAYPQKLNKDEPLARLNELQPNDQLLMTLTLKPLVTPQQALNNPSGFDSYRWLRARHIDGVADIIAVGTPIATPSHLSQQTTSSNSYFTTLRIAIDHWRWQLRQHFYQDWAQQNTAQQQAKAVTLSLLTGDRSLINRDTKDLYQLAGISHLLAISGTHILFLAIMLAGAVVLLFNRFYPKLYRTIPRWQVRWWVMIGAAFIYALFTGFDAPAARTAWTLLAIGLVRLTLLPVSTMSVLLALAILMAWVDPYVLWQAGYWLSFIAVALLLKYDDARDANIKQSQSSQRPTPTHSFYKKVWLLKIWPLCKRIFKLQCWLFIALLPVTLLLFDKVSMWGLVINLFAIGLFGWVIVPLNLLAGLFYLIMPAVADSIWALVSAIIAGLHELITWLTTLPALQRAWLFTPVNTGMLLMALLIILPWLLPRGLISRWLAVPPLTLLMMTVYANQQALSLTPTLYVLPTGDRYLSATLLQYPINERQIDSNKKQATNDTNDSVSWLLLANHRPQGRRTMASSLTADKLSALLEQQLRTLSIKHLEGIIVQTSVAALTTTLPSSSPSKTTAANNSVSSSMLLPMTVAQLSQRFPTKQYWQAGGHARWSALKKIYLQDSPAPAKALISAQGCEQGKSWQLPNGDLTLQAITGWSGIDDASVGDCTLAIDSGLPITIVQYDASNPLQSPRLSKQALLAQKPIKNTQQRSQNQPSQSRIVVDAATHKRVWQMWSLLCSATPFAIDNTSANSISWLSHSSSQVSAEILRAQNVNTVLTYDDKNLAVALAIIAEP